MPGAGALNVYRRWEKLPGGIGNKSAVHLLVYKIAPAADGLPQRNAGSQCVAQGEQIDLLPQGENHHPNEASD